MSTTRRHIDALERKKLHKRFVELKGLYPSRTHTDLIATLQEEWPQPISLSAIRRHIYKVDPSLQPHPTAKLVKDNFVSKKAFSDITNMLLNDQETLAKDLEKLILRVDALGTRVEILDIDRKEALDKKGVLARLASIFSKT